MILNEHLTESLRRLKKDSTENSVDRCVAPRGSCRLTSLSRLVSNVLITFLNTPRSDTKRFEMLNLISSILSWTDDQRERVGLQRSSGISAPGVVTSGSRTHRGHARSGKGKAVDDGLGENEVSRPARSNQGADWLADVLGALDRVPAARGARERPTSTDDDGLESDFAGQRSGARPCRPPTAVRSSAAHAAAAPQSNRRALGIQHAAATAVSNSGGRGHCRMRTLCCWNTNERRAAIASLIQKADRTRRL